jgi:hypothetical protein
MDPRPALPAPAEPPPEYGFAAAFVHLRTVTLERRAGAPGALPAEIVHTAAGHFWVVDAENVRIHGPDGRSLYVLRGGHRLAELGRPASLAMVHGAWVAVLDAGLGRVRLYDARARATGGFDIPQVDDPRQIRCLADRHLVVVGAGGPGGDRLVHVYALDGRHVESLYSIAARTVRETARTRAARAHDAPETPTAPAASAAAGTSLLLAYGPSRAVTVYDFATRMVRAFPTPARPDGIEGVFAGPEGQVIVMHRESGDPARYGYTLHAPDGAPLLANVRSPQRVVGVEGRLVYSVGPADGSPGTALRICRLRDLASLGSA